MDEPTPQPSPAPTPAPAAPTPAPEPVALVKPEFLPADYWDEKAGIKTDEFAKHYGELTAAQQKLAERAPPAKPDDYKIEVKLPDTVKVPEGMTFDPSKDPRLPVLRQVAHELGLTNTEVNRLVALDAELAIQNHTAEQARVAEETKKLGEKATDRIAAVTNWAKALQTKGDLSADEFNEIRMTASTAVGVTALEKLMAKAAGTVPGHVPTPPPKVEPQNIADRIWPGGFSPTPQARTG
jgi:hypothetical protein